MSAKEIIIIQGPQGERLPVPRSMCVLGPQDEFIAFRGSKWNEARYSDDQPRDDHGRWTEGAGEMVTVYHGKALGKGKQPMNPQGFYVTTDKMMAAKYFGDVHQVDVPKSELLPDPEVEGFEDKKLTGEESLKLGSAIAPSKYYEKLVPVGPKTYTILNSKGKPVKVTIPED